MKIGFVEQCFEKLAVEYLISICKRAGADVQLFLDPTLFADAFYENNALKGIFDYSDKLAARIARSDVDVLAFSVVSDDFLWAARIASKVKQLRDITTVFGGVHPTAVPEYVAANPAVDFVCQGEGEETIVELLDALSSGRKPADIPNICFYDGNRLVKNSLRSLERDMDLVPFPDKELFYEQMPLMRNFYMTITSRYCPFRCTFCYNSTYRDLYTGKGKYLRQRSPENVVEELKLASKYNYKYVMFNDDILGFNKRWVREFAPLYGREIGKPFFCYYHPQYSDEETVSLLADAGCVTANMGIQSIDPDVRSRLFDRWETQDDIRNAISCITRHKIYLNTGHIIGFPGDTEAIEETAGHFYAKTRPDIIGCYWLRLYPGTKITKMVMDSGDLSAEEIDQINRGEGKSFWLGGSAKHQQEIKPFSILFNSLPLLPTWVLRFFLKNKRYRALRKLPFLIVMLVTRVALAMANIKDLYGRWGLFLVVARLRLYALNHIQDFSEGWRRGKSNDASLHRTRTSLAAAEANGAPSGGKRARLGGERTPERVKDVGTMREAVIGRGFDSVSVGQTQAMAADQIQAPFPLTRSNFKVLAAGSSQLEVESRAGLPNANNCCKGEGYEASTCCSENLPTKVVAGASSSEVLVQIESRRRGWIHRSED